MPLGEKSKVLLWEGLKFSEGSAKVEVVQLQES